MNHLFDADNPVMTFLGRAADLVWLNLLTMVCCIPIVTAGAALTALHYVCIKMVRKEESYLTKSFFSSFRKNFVQATAVWILAIFLLAVVRVDFYLIAGMDGSAAFIMRVIVCAFCFFLVCCGVYCFPLLARFENSIKNTLKNACLIGIANFPKSLCIVAVYCVFAALYALFYMWLLPLIFFLGISVPVYTASYLISGIFKKLEPEEEEIGQSV